MSDERVIVCGSAAEMAAARVLFPAARVVDGRRTVAMVGLRPAAWLIMPSVWGPSFDRGAWEEVWIRARTSGGKVCEVQADLRLVEVAP